MSGILEGRVSTPHRWPWIAVAVVIVVSSFVTTFLTTLATEDWKQCFEAAGVRSLPHMFAVNEYPWIAHWKAHVWSVGIAAIVAIGLVLLRSTVLAVLTIILLSPVIWIGVHDLTLMAAELVRGEVVTAQYGYHHCDRKGHDGADLIAVWNYVAIGAGFVAMAGMLLKRLLIGRRSG